jgi:fucose permease
MFDPVTMLAMFGPTIVRAFEGLYQRYIAPDAVKATTVADAVALENAETEKLKVITQADTGGETYKWVEAIRKLQRPVVVFATLAAFLYNPAQVSVSEIFQTVMWYLFGERVNMVPTEPKK